MIEMLIENIRSLKVSEDIAPKDQMYNPAAGMQRYLSVGRSGLRLIETALMARAGYPGGDTPISRILDFGCAYGRVTRFLRVAFPAAEIDVTDINAEAVDWCAATLGVNATSGPVARDTYDLIFLGSVFTHTRAEVTADILSNLSGALRSNGVLIFTTQGRYTHDQMLSRLEGDYLGLTAAQRGIVVTDYVKSGHGFAEYSPGRGYGIALADRKWVENLIGKRQDIIQILFQEKGFDNNQDAHAFMKTPLREGGKRSGL